MTMDAGDRDSSRTEIERLTAARAGDERAFEELTRPFQRELHIHCYRLLGSLDDADDALQETLLRAWRGIGGFEPRAPLGAWLHRIATNVCLRMLEQRKRHTAAAVDAHPEPYPERLPAWDAVDIDGIVALLADDALLTMPPEDARIAGAGAIGTFFATQPAAGRLDRIRLVPARANGQPALAAYADEEETGRFDA